MSIDKLFCGTCPGCGHIRGSLWRDRSTDSIVAPCIQCRKGITQRPVSAEMGVFEHLGNVLHLLSDLHPDDRTQALDNALEFYNKNCPTKRIEPSGFPIQRLVSHQQSVTEPK